MKYDLVVNASLLQQEIIFDLVFVLVPVLFQLVDNILQCPRHAISIRIRRLHPVEHRQYSHAYD